jgi:hypothetical protein
MQLEEIQEALKRDVQEQTQAFETALEEGRDQLDTAQDAIALHKERETVPCPARWVAVFSHVLMLG